MQSLESARRTGYPLDNKSPLYARFAESDAPLAYEDADGAAIVSRAGGLRIMGCAPRRRIQRILPDSADAFPHS